MTNPFLPPPTSINSAKGKSTQSGKDAKPWTAWETGLIYVCLALKGLSPRETGLILDRSRGAIIGRAHRVGIPIAPNGPQHSKKKLTHEEIRERERQRYQAKRVSPGLEYRAKRSVQVKYKVVKTKIRVPRALPPIPVRREIAMPVEPLRLTIMQLTNSTCRMPLANTEGADTLFCGHATEEMSPWCEWHKGIVWEKTKPLSEERLMQQILRRDKVRGM